MLLFVVDSVHQTGFILPVKLVVHISIAGLVICVILLAMLVILGDCFVGWKFIVVEVDIWTSYFAESAFAVLPNLHFTYRGVVCRQCVWCGEWCHFGGVEYFKVCFSRCDSFLSIPFTKPVSLCQSNWLCISRFLVWSFVWFIGGVECFGGSVL